MFVIEFLIIVIITGFFYMIGPVVYVKIRGRVNSRKAFWLSFLNWMILHTVFLGIYNLIYPNEISTATSIGPGLWLFFAWKYMSVKESEINKTYKKQYRNNVDDMSIKDKNNLSSGLSNNTRSKTKNSIGDLKDKFKIDFKDSIQETHTRDNFKFAVFIFKTKLRRLKSGEIVAIVVSRLQSNNYRYFTVEASIQKSFILCELRFDDNNREINRLNYSNLDLTRLDSSIQDININTEVLINRINIILESPGKDFSNNE